MILILKQLMSHFLIEMFVLNLAVAYKFCARVCSNVSDFNNRNQFLTAKLLKQGYRYHKLRKAFSKFYQRHSELTVKNNVFCNRANQSQYFMVIYFIHSKELLESLLLVINLKKIIKHYKKKSWIQHEYHATVCLPGGKPNHGL